MLRSRLIILPAAVLLLALGLLADVGSTAASAKPVPVDITDSGFSPALVTVPPGTTITWMNRGSSDHSVNGDGGVRPSSPSLSPGDAYSYTFRHEGEFRYHDGSNPGSVGRIVISVGAPVPESPIIPPPAIEVSAPEPDPVTQPVFAIGAQDSAPEAGLEASSAPAAAPQRVSSSDGVVVVDAGNEWFGDASYQGGVYETVVHEGGSVRWNMVQGLHNVFECGDNWSQLGGSCGSSAWSSDMVVPEGSSYTRTFDAGGVFYYVCVIHPLTMRGKVTVETAGDTPPQPTVPADSPSSGSVDEPISGSSPDPVVAGQVSLPQGGGPPLTDQLLERNLIFLLVAAAALIVSTAVFIGGGMACNRSEP